MARLNYFLIAYLVSRAGAATLGIIGSGVAGASTARFARDALGADLDIIVWERDSVVGGRAKSVVVRAGPDETSRVSRGAERLVDAGATDISTLNEYLVNFTLEAGLARKNSTATGDLAIYDGEAIRFRSGEGSLSMAAHLVERYGIGWLKLMPSLNATVANLSRVYELQRRGAAFDTPEGLFRALGLYETTQVTAYDYFRGLGVPEAFIEEFIDGASRDNYNQPGTMNAFADLVSLAGAALDGAVFELEKGTAAVPKYLLESAGADVRLNTTVAAVRAREGGGHVVIDGSGHETSVDAVVVATPLEFAALELPASAWSGPPRAYQETYVAFAAGTLSGDLRGLDAVLTVETDEIDFSCVGAHGDLAGSTVYKVFSRRYLADAEVDQIFDARTSAIARWSWNATGAYTKLDPVDGGGWPPFVLDDGLFYANMESPVSCMETQVIAGKNAALLAAGALGRGA